MNKGRILIADDESLFRDTTADFLINEGFDCDRASDGYQANELIERNQYDLLIADIKMPGNENLEFIKVLQEKDAGIPVILVTAYASLETALPAFNLPVKDYIRKPVDLDELLAIAVNSIKQSRLVQAVRASRRELQNWGEELDKIEDVGGGGDILSSSASHEKILSFSLQNMAKSLIGIQTALEACNAIDSDIDICKMLKCPKISIYKEWIKESIRVLEGTKTAFRSKEVADLRIKLEVLLKEENM